VCGSLPRLAGSQACAQKSSAHHCDPGASCTHQGNTRSATVRPFQVLWLKNQYSPPTAPQPQRDRAKAAAHSSHIGTVQPRRQRHTRLTSGACGRTPVVHKYHDAQGQAPEGVNGQHTLATTGLQ
jgi:hypothetical protein